MNIGVQLEMAMRAHAGTRTYISELLTKKFTCHDQ